MIRTKVIRVGNSLGVILPTDLLKERDIKVGQDINVEITGTQQHNIMKFFGTMRDLPSFDEIEHETDEED